MTGQPKEIEKYTKVPNEILDALAQAKLNGTQYAICLVIFRNTFGFHRCGHEMSATYIGKATNIIPRQIKRELQALINRNIILKTNIKQGVTSTVGFNKDITTWKPVSKKTPVSNPTPAVVSKKTPVPVSNPTPKKERVKENIKEIYIVTSQQIFDHWNQQGIIIHKEMTEVIQKEIIKALNKYDMDTIMLAITHYSKIYNDEGYYFKYKWTLSKFLTQKNCIPDFLDEGLKWINYQKQNKSKPVNPNRAALDRMT